MWKSVVDSVRDGGCGRVLGTAIFVARHTHHTLELTAVVVTHTRSVSKIGQHAGRQS